jgi:hypothetical protein
MGKQYTLAELVQLADENGTLDDVSDLIIRLYAQNDEEALELMIKLAFFDYGGGTYKGEFQTLGVVGCLHWGVYGIKKLSTATIANDGYRAISNVTRMLSNLSAESLEMLYLVEKPCVNMLDITSAKYKTDEWTTNAKEALVEVVMSVEENDPFPISIIQQIGFSKSTLASEHLFAALMARWFNFDAGGLKGFAQLIEKSDFPEIIFQNYLKANPLILEPFHAQIWSKPRFGEALVPDFLIRSMDNTYTVVEIERPDMKIMTKAGELSADTTHAKRQALDFRDWASSNQLYAQQTYQGIGRPFCLVVIGLEHQLNNMQLKRLQQENESTQGILKIVGFDWLLKRAKSTFDNLIKYGFDKNTFKEVIDITYSSTE